MAIWDFLTRRVGRDIAAVIWGYLHEARGNLLNNLMAETKHLTWELNAITLKHTIGRTTACKRYYAYEPVHKDIGGYLPWFITTHRRYKYYYSGRMSSRLLDLTDNVHKQLLGEKIEEFVDL